MMTNENKFDVVILGSGFTGAMLATILSSQGRRVALVDKQSHPRMAIGESSTPLADRLLEYLGRRYDQPAWVHLSTYGGWKAHLQQLGCGLKRGFSYYRHPIDIDEKADFALRSLLVAASASDEGGDTHWYRPDVDRFLFGQAIGQGVVDLTGHEVTGLTASDGPAVTIRKRDRSRTLLTDWVFDATGRSAVTAKLTAAPSLRHELATESYCRYTHVRGLNRWAETLDKIGLGTQVDPFDCDAAAQHHLIDDGWIWNLRFDNGITSVGQVMRRPPERWMLREDGRVGRLESEYPELAEHLAHGVPLFRAANVGRLQQLFDPLISDRIVMLPTAAATIDPLHSTGIAMGLAGVARAARLVLDRPNELRKYQDCLFHEVRLLDRLVSTAYRWIEDFGRFSIACQLFFVAAIRSEEQIEAAGFDECRPLYFADCDAMASAIDASINCLDQSSKTESAGQKIASLIAPWNQVGLFDPAAGNRYAYTATK